MRNSALLNLNGSFTGIYFVWFWFSKAAEDVSDLGTAAEGTTTDMGCNWSGTGVGCDAQWVCVDTLTSPLHPIPLGPAVTPPEDANCSFSLEVFQESL